MLQSVWESCWECRELGGGVIERLMAEGQVCAKAFWTCRSGQWPGPVLALQWLDCACSPLTSRALLGAFSGDSTRVASSSQGATLARWPSKSRHLQEKHSAVTLRLTVSLDQTWLGIRQAPRVLTESPRLLCPLHGQHRPALPSLCYHPQTSSAQCCERSSRNSGLPWPLSRRSRRGVLTLWPWRVPLCRFFLATALRSCCSARSAKGRPVPAAPCPIQGPGSPGQGDHASLEAQTVTAAGRQPTCLRDQLANGLAEAPAPKLPRDCDLRPHPGPAAPFWLCAHPTVIWICISLTFGNVEDLLICSPYLLKNVYSGFLSVFNWAGYLISSCMCYLYIL